MFVITLSSLLTSLIYKFILVPLGFEYLQTIVFILFIAALVQFVEMFLKKSDAITLSGTWSISSTDHNKLCGSWCSTYKCPERLYNLEGVVNGVGTSVGFLIAIVIMAGIREKIEYNDISESFQGTPIVLLTACLMAIAFCGFSGLI